MLDSDTKRRIDTARDILVGKVPDPKSQVEQITLALIYKFMDDMDAESEEHGGKRAFFANEFTRYGWAKLMAPSVGGHELVGLYGEGIAKMPENPGIPPLFREIFKNAFLPYRDPETLRSFLKIINEFEYDHSERLGDAFEYLLSVLGSQGDAGQFRTPRHIIDFIVKVVDPKKSDTILDPACGTAGFLISAWKHIVKANSNSGRAALTPDERKKLAEGITGYDISPDMVRLSRANMYLHQLTDPHICEYDSLTSLDRWNENFDVILANPPFMSPKGGIKPHNRFGVQSKRSEVLFVDYMAEHLTPNGRAGIIVPEGIIFQSQTAYVELRKMLVNDYLVAVVSLPAGVFNPYSGVKTSILILDRSLARLSDTIGFFKVDNDGFGLGAQRREVKGEQLTRVAAEIGEYLGRLRARHSVEDLLPTLGLIVPKAQIAENGDYNLSAERYRVGDASVSTVPKVRLGDVLTLEFGTRITKREDQGSLYPVYGGGGESFRTDTFTRENDVVVSRFAMSAECVRVVLGKFYLLDSGFTFSVAEPFTDRAHKAYIARLLLSVQDRIYSCARGHAQKNIDIDAFKAIEIPLPPLEVQREIVAEIEGYQKVIDGARAVVDHYRPHIPIRPEWPIVPLQDVAHFQEGPGIMASDFCEAGVPLVRLAGLGGAKVSLEGCNYLDPVKVAGKWSHFRLRTGDILVSTSASFGRPALVDSLAEGAVFYTGLIRFQPKDQMLNAGYLQTFLGSPAFLNQAEAFATGSSIRHFGPMHLKQMNIQLPPLETQHQIVAAIEAEQRLVAANRELVERFEKKIQAAIARVWGEEASPSTVATGGGG